MALLPANECLLCIRKAQRKKYISTTILHELAPTNKIVQKFESKIGPGGYRDDVCIGPDPNKKNYNGFISKIAVGLASHYTWVHDANGGWKIDQSALYFEQAPPGNPRLGNNGIH